MLSPVRKEKLNNTEDRVYFLTHLREQFFSIKAEKDYQRSFKRLGENVNTPTAIRVIIEQSRLNNE